MLETVGVVGNLQSVRSMGAYSYKRAYRSGAFDHLEISRMIHFSIRYAPIFSNRHIVRQFIDDNSLFHRRGILRFAQNDDYKLL